MSRWRPGGVTAARGFVAAGTWSGIKRNRRPDLALIVSRTPAVAAGVFTINRVKAAPVLLTQRHIRSGTARAVLVNSGCANCLTGAAGMRDAVALTGEMAQLLDMRLSDMLVASTGVIGRRLPVRRIRRALPRLARQISVRGHRDAAWAILTTDTHPKEVAVEWREGATTVRLGGMAKGAGMIEPHMATMLAFFTTDAAISRPLLQRALREATQASFNRITVDGDASTNDTVLILANGQARNRPITTTGPAYRRFVRHLTAAAVELATQIVRDGEGATKVAAIEVVHAATARDAERCAYKIANSPLVKTMLAGGDWNFGRMAAAAGASGARFDPDKLRILLDGRVAVANGVHRQADRAALRLLSQGERLTITVDLQTGHATATVWTCDLTEEYVRINARYTS